MTVTRYGYRHALNAFREVPLAQARALLPRHLEPIELRHGVGVLSVTVFDFAESEVGAYGELVMSVMVAPLVRPGERMPKAALFPYRVATTTRAAREHAIERWHLPHWMEDVEVRWREGDGSLTARVTAGGVPVVQLTVVAHQWRPTSQYYQCFSADASGRYLADITMAEGPHCEHEEETGELLLFPHAFHEGLELSALDDVPPFRELWLREGVQTFQPLRTLGR